MVDGFFYIETQDTEYGSSPKAFFKTLEEAKDAMRYFSDHYGWKGTGKIYFQPFGIVHYIKENEQEAEILYDEIVVSKDPEYVCRGTGLNADGNAVFTI